MGATVIVDCEQGRSLGCESFCCRLIVRLQPGERDPTQPDNELKHCVDKDPRDGLCVHFSRQDSRCGIWPQRPATCRRYDCNRDPLLPVVLDSGFDSLVQLALRAAKRPAPARNEDRIAILETLRSTVPPPPDRPLVRRRGPGTQDDDP